MYYRINERNEIVDILPGYYRGYHNDIGKKLAEASDEQKRIFAIPENEIVELTENTDGDLFVAGIAKYVVRNGKIIENPEAVKTEALAKLNVLCDEAVSSLTKKYPKCEVESFAVKRELAKQWETKDATAKAQALLSDDFALLAHEAASIADVKAVDTLVAKIKNRIKQYDIHVGMCIRIKNTIAQRISASDGSREAIEAILRDVIFPAAD